MPGKSRHGKGRRSLQSKIKKSRQRSLSAVAQQPAVTQTAKPATPAVMAATSTSGQARLATASAIRYPYIACELLSIGVLTGIILVILIVLDLVYS